MAFTAREVLMVFRGQNYLSSTIRKVGRDVGSLSRSQQLGLQRSQMQITAQRLRQSRALDLAERTSIVSGVRRQALDKATIANRNALAAAETNLAQAKLRQEANDTALMERQVRASRLNRLAAAGRPLSGHTLEETNRLAQAASARVKQLGEMQNILSQRTALATKALSANALEKQILIEKDAQLAQREAFLTQRINNTSRALLRNRDLQAENAAQTRALPLQQWRDYARTVEHVGTVLARVGAFATVAVGLAAHAAANLNTQAVLAATQARPPGAPVAATARIAGRIQTQVMSLIREFPSSAQEFNDAFYQVFSGTNIQSVSKATDLIRVFAKAAVAGGTDLKTMVDAGISLHNVFPGEFKNATQAANVFFAAVRYGRLNAAQLSNALGYIVPIAKDVGLNFRNVAGDIAFFTKQTGGRLTRQDAQGLARLYQLFGRQDVTQGLAQHGIAVFNAAGKMRPLVDILDDVRKRMHLTNQETLNFFKTVSAQGSGKSGTQGTIQALRIFSLGVHSGNEYRNVVNKVAHDQNEMIRSFEAMSRTPGVRWQVFINQLRALVYTIGTQAIPVLIKMSRPLQAMIGWFQRLSPHTQRLIALFVTFVSVGSLVGGSLLAIVGGLASLALSVALLVSGRGGITRLVAGSRGAKVALAGMNSEAGFISARFALGLGLPVVIFLLIKFHKQVSEVVHALGGWMVVMTALTAGLAALRFAPMITAMIGIATEANTAAAGVGGLRLALLSLAGPEVLIALAAVAAALVALDLFKDRGKHFLTQTNTNVNARVVRDPEGNLFRENVTANRGSRGRMRRLTPAEAEALGNPTNHPRNAIRQAIEDSPRYQHVIHANQAAVDAFSKSLDYLNRKRFEHTVTVAVAAIQKSPNILQQIRNIQSLRAEAISTPNQQAGLAAWTRYENALTALLQGKTAAQRAAIRSVLKTAVLPAAAQQRSVQDWISLVERARKKMLGDPSDVKAAQAYETVVANLNARFKNQPNLLAAINDVLGTYDQNIKKATDGTKTLGVTFQDVLSKVQSMYQDFKSQETSIFGTLFSGPFANSPATQNRLQFGGQLSGQDLLHDLRSQVTQFREFHGQLNELSQRGAPFALIQQIEQLGPDATMGKLDRFGNRGPSIMQRILGLSPEQRREYFNTFRQSQKLIQDQSMRDLNSQLSQYRKHGRNIALAIVAGLRDENVALTKAITKMIHNMFPNLPVGATGAGGRPTHHPPAVQHHHHHHDTTHIHVVAPKKDHATIKAQVRHADITRRNRNQGRGGVPR